MYTLSSKTKVSLLALSVVFALSACNGDDGDNGPQGPVGAQGPAGQDGAAGQDGTDGADGSDGQDGSDGASVLSTSTVISAPGVQPCLNGVVLTRSGADTNRDGILDDAEVTSSFTTCGTTEQPAPMSSMVANYLTDGGSITDYVIGLVNTYATSGTAPAGFPLENGLTDSVRLIPGMSHNVVTQWFDNLTTDGDGAFFGSNADYSAYFGDNWNSDWAGDVVGSAPQFNGNPRAGYMWINHEYISDGEPEVGIAPTGQNMSVAMKALSAGVLDFDIADDSAWTAERVDTFIDYAKRQLGGAWFRIIQRDSGEWTTEKVAAARRYDATSNTISSVTGFELSQPDIDDDGAFLPEGHVAGILGDCSGGQTPWGTIFTAEENVQSYYGDLEDAWSSRQTFDPASGWGPGAAVQLNYSPVAAGDANFTKSDPALNHNREVYGFLTEIDPGVDANLAYTSVASGGTGEGHRKLGAMGRARWENTTFAVDTDYQLVNGQPIVMYGGNDRRSGRIYKFVTDGVYTDGMTKGQVRALLDEGTVYVAHFADLDTRTGYTLVPADGSACATADVFESGTDNKADVFAAGCESPTIDNRGTGRWIELSLSSTDVAPNAPSLGAGTTVGDALQNNTWNSIGGFPDDNTVLSAMFTASMKIGVMELNRPEDLEYNPVDNTIYIAFTSHGRPTALTQDGVMKNSGTGGISGEEERRDDEGAIFAMQEGNVGNPGASDTFTFWASWQGERGNCEFCGENPDNIMIDQAGGVWFGTDGNFSTSRNTTDSLYYLDLDPTHREGQPGIAFATYGRPFRVLSGPSNSEATGPVFNSDMSTIFFNVQHPGEGSQVSTWPNL